MRCYGLWRQRSRSVIFSKPIKRAEGLVCEGSTRKTVPHPCGNPFLQFVGRVLTCIKFQQWNLDFKLEQFGPMTCGQFPFNVGANLGLIVSTLRQPFTQLSR